MLEVEITDAENGDVAVTFSADRTNFYRVSFGDGSPQVEQPAAGTLQHTYAESGAYTITVQAHATPSEFVSVTEQVTIALGNETNPFDLPATGYEAQTSYPGMQLVWADEFDGNTLNTANWTHEIGTGSNGWGNNELQYYRPENTLIQNGHLIIQAKEESFGGRNYTSSRIISQNKQSFQYGRIDFRAALPKGQGIWPALWMLGESFGSTGWPFCGEIDIMEMIGGDAPGRDNTVHGTIHWDNNGQYANTGDSYSLSGAKFYDEWHVFSILWDENFIRWYVDDIEYYVVDITPGGLSEFQEEFFFIMNIAVGGNWPGSPDATTEFPQRMAVDYVRVYQEQ